MAVTTGGSLLAPVTPTTPAPQSAPTAAPSPVSPTQTAPAPAAPTPSAPVASPTAQPFAAAPVTPFPGASGSAASPDRQADRRTWQLQVTPEPKQRIKQVAMAAIGDSITAFTDRNGARTPWSWVRTAAVGGVQDAGGYRHWGDNTAQILAHTGRVKADVVVVMAGTNDIGDGTHPVPTAQTLANVSAIFDRAGVKARILSAVAPKNDGGAAATLKLNQALRQLAAQKGWTFVDPWATLRTSNGRWVAGATVDGTHPTARSGAIAGAALRAAVVAVSPDRSIVR